MKIERLGAVAILAASAIGCTANGGSGDVAVTIWGEEYIEQGIPSEAFEDGWSARFDKFIVAVSGVRLSGASGEVGGIDGMTVFDLVSPGPHEVGMMSAIEAVAHDDFGYAVMPAGSDAVGHASVSDADLAMMKDNGYAIHVAGSFSDGSVEKTFAWSFTAHTHYAKCVDVAGSQEVPGVVVTAGGQAEAQLTIHGDHLFYDDLLSSDAVLRGENLALADADADGEVTQSELSAFPLANIPGDSGPYGVAASDVDDFGGYLDAATRTLGHFNGEGHCEVE